MIALAPAATELWTWAFPWRFHSPESLREEGLEQYMDFADSVKIGRYGEFVFGDEASGESHLCSLRRRQEIDLCMVEFGYPVMRALLDTYYRQGLSCEHRGWMETARRVRVQGVWPRSCQGPVRCRVADNRFDLPTCGHGKGCETDHDTFEVQVWLAIERLWHVHEERCRRYS